MRMITRYEVPPSLNTFDAVPDLMTEYHDTIVRGFSSAGRVHPARFWRLSRLGDVEIFVGARNPIKRVQASVALLWDFSGSQQNFRDALIYSIMSVGSGMQRAGLHVWAGAYTTERNGVGIFEINGWRDKWDHRRAATLEQIKMGDTPTGDAMRYVRKFILPRAPTDRRMIVVCTDGDPGDRQLASYEAAACRGFGPVVGLYVGSRRTGVGTTLADWVGPRYAFDAPTREDIPHVFTQILARLRG